MSTPRRAALALLLLGAWSSRSEASPAAGVAVVEEDGASEPVARDIALAARRAGAAALGPREVRAALESEEALAAHRSRALEQLGEAIRLVANVRYDDALIRLATAEREALASLARVAAPRLLADIHLQRGLALLATDAEAAHRSFVLSFQLWPGRSLDATKHAPRILQALAQAARAARRTVPAGLRAGEAARLARLLRVQTILCVQASSSGQNVRAVVRRFDAERDAWSGETAVEWLQDAAPAELHLALRPVLTLIPASHRSDEGLRPQRIGAWILFGASAVALAAGIGLTVQSVGNFNEARSLVNPQNPIDYAPKARDLEESGGRARTGAIVSFCIGAAAAVAATILWVRSGESRPRSPRVSVVPGGLSVSWR